MRDQLRGLQLVISSSFKASPRLAILGFTLEPLGYLISTFSALFVKGVVDGITAHDPAAVRTDAIWLGALLSAGVLLRSVGWRYRTELLERTGSWLDARILELSGQIPGLEHHERPEYHDRLQALEGTNLGNTLFGIIPGLAALLKLLAATALLATLHPALLLLPLFAVPSVWFGVRAQHIQQDAWDAMSPHWRRANACYDLAMKAGSAKELRIFGLLTENRRRHTLERAAGSEGLRRANLRGAAWKTYGWMVFGIGYLGALGLVAVRAINGENTTGDLVLAISLAAQLNASVSDVAYEVQDVVGKLRAAKHFLWLEDLATGHLRTIDATPPHRLQQGIRFENVSFTYPGTDHEVLSDVDLFLPAGSRVAIVGDNGAGKTTLVKLLCGFYEPTSGRITLDGVSLDRVDPIAWRGEVAGAFQDYCRFEFIAAETVGLGDLPRIDDVTAVARALERAGATEVPGKLRDGLATQLGRSFDKGVDLSMGQWQKLALSRAFMREAPVLLVLDEPTASLDAPTEHAVFTRYAEQAAARRADGAVTLLVSHRFSTVRVADLIVVVDGGQVRETGTHAELMAAGGLYAELFELQAAAYR